MLTSRGLGVVLGDLAAMGFDAEWGVLGARDVGATASGLRLATPTATANQLSPSMMKHPGCRAWLPTPTATSYGTNQGGGAGRVGVVRMSLQTMASKNAWPTPTVQDAKNNGGASQMRRKSPPLNAAVKLVGTPTARMAMPSEKFGAGRVDTPAEMAKKAGGSLNPTWVEWLMGWPLGWSALEPLEMGRFQRWLRSHGACSANVDEEVTS